MGEQWRTGDFDRLCRALLAMRDGRELAALLRDLCTLAELEAMGHRLAAARLVDDGVPYADVAARLGTSTTTVTRVAHWLRHGEGGYRLALDRLAADPPPASAPAAIPPRAAQQEAP